LSGRASAQDAPERRTSEIAVEVILARAAGFCFGVRDGLALALAADDPRDVTIYGEFVHNPDVRAVLAARGFRETGEAARETLSPTTRRVLVTAHGLSDRARARLRAAGRELIDATCPIVRRAHGVALAFAATGRHVVVIGDPAHVETRGLVEDLPSYDVVPDPAAARPLGKPRLGVLAQTTTPPDLARRTTEALIAANPDAEVRFADTICEPTKDRLRAVRELASRVDGFVVVGGPTSRNTLRLAEEAEAAGRPALVVRGPGDLLPAFFAGRRRIGLTAGTSTPDDALEAVRRAVAAF
jgi:4-hydroxy-3-methylbut-2-enyl diphosphate reductase